MFKPLREKEVLSAVSMPRSDIDTDALMPKFALKSVKASGYGEYLFDERRFKDRGSLDKKLSDRIKKDNFELNVFEKLFNKVPGLLITGPNFGCGSSREHAVWGLVQYGIKVIIGYSDKEEKGFKAAFADIFRNNSAKNGLLLIELPKEHVLFLKEACEAALKSCKEYAIEVNLKDQCVFVAGREFQFNIDKRTKNKFLNGLDDADEIKSNYFSDIQSHEERIRKEMPFLMEPIFG